MCQKPVGRSKVDSWERLVDSGEWDRAMVTCQASDSRPTLARIPELLPRDTAELCAVLFTQEEGAHGGLCLVSLGWDCSLPHPAVAPLGAWLPV